MGSAGPRTLGVRGGGGEEPDSARPQPPNEAWAASPSSSTCFWLLTPPHHLFSLTNGLITILPTPHFLQYTRAEPCKNESLLNQTPNVAAARPKRGCECTEPVPAGLLWKERKRGGRWGLGLPKNVFVLQRFSRNLQRRSSNVQRTAPGLGESYRLPLESCEAGTCPHASGASRCLPCSGQPPENPMRFVQPHQHQHPHPHHRRHKRHHLTWTPSRTHTVIPSWADSAP